MNQRPAGLEAIETASVDALRALQLDRLADAGFDLVETEVVGAHELDAECGFPIVFFEVAEDLPAYLATLPGPERELTLADVLAAAASPDVRGALEVALSGAFTEQAYRAAMSTRDALRSAYGAALRNGGDRLDASLAGLDCMISVDNWLNETTRHADVILPGLSALEQAHHDDLIWMFAVGSRSTSYELAPRASRSWRSRGILRKPRMSRGSRSWIRATAASTTDSKPNTRARRVR